MCFPHLGVAGPPPKYPPSTNKLHVQSKFEMQCEMPVCNANAKLHLGPHPNGTLSGARRAASLQSSNTRLQARRLALQAFNTLPVEGGGGKLGVGHAHTLTVGNDRTLAPHPSL